MLNLNGARWCLVDLDGISDSLSLRAWWREERWNWRSAAADWQALHLDDIMLVCLKTRPPNRFIGAGIEAIRDNALYSSSWRRQNAKEYKDNLPPVSTLFWLRASAALK